MKEGGNKKQQIVLAAIQLFSAKGYYATRPKDIAARAGVSVGLLYHYFSSKKEIFKAVFQYMQNLLKENCEWVNRSLKEGADIKISIFSLTKAIMEKLQENPQYMNFWMMEKEVLEVFDEEKKELWIAFKDLIKNFFKNIGINLEDEQLLFLAGIYLQLLKQRLMYYVFFIDTPTDLNIAEEAQLITDFFLGGLQNVYGKI